MSTGLSPLVVKELMVVPAAAAAAGDQQTVWVAPWAGTVTGVSYVADTALTGANTNTRKVSLVNKGTNGLGTTEMAALQFDSGVNAAAFKETPITLSATTANRNFVVGAVLTWKTEAVGTGVADPGGTVYLALERG